MSAAAMPTLYLVDASMYVFRAWHSMPDEFHDADGWPTNAVHGFARFLLELLEKERPRHIAVAFDEALTVAPALAPDIVLLDNMSPAQLREAVALRVAAGAACELEASGGITLDTVRDVAETGVDVISVGALTHSAASVDIGLDFDE